jgi:hypothetical protein
MLGSLSTPFARVNFASRITRRPLRGDRIRWRLDEVSLALSAPRGVERCDDPLGWRRHAGKPDYRPNRAGTEVRSPPALAEGSTSLPSSARWANREIGGLLLLELYAPRTHARPPQNLPPRSFGAPMVGWATCQSSVTNVSTASSTRPSDMRAHLLSQPQQSYPPPVITPAFPRERRRTRTHRARSRPRTIAH